MNSSKDSSAVKTARLGSVVTAIASLVLSVALASGAWAAGKAGEVPQPAENFGALFTIEAGGGSFEKLAGGTHRLTLHDVAKSAGYSAEQPEPASGETGTKAIIDLHRRDPANPPTAAVVIIDPAAPANQNVMIGKLGNPVYDEALATLSFDMQPETSYQGKNLAPHVADADNSLPAKFGPVSVKFDWPWPSSCSDGHINCYRHYGCCNQPAVTQPVGGYKGGFCWSWGPPGCAPCSNDCASQFPNECGGGDCYNSCTNDSSCSP